MAEYQHLKNQLMLWTAFLVGIVGAVVWLIYGTVIGQSFCLGGLVGIAYIGMLARSVDRIDRGKPRLGIARFGLFIALMILASRWQSLALLPAFLGFLTYKLAVLALMLRDLRS